MAFLRLNGITIPVATGQASLEHEDIGSNDRAFDGTKWSDRRARKRKWKLKTPPLDETEAKAVEGIIRGLGHVFHYDDGDDVYGSYERVDDFSSKGLGPSTALGVSGFFRFGRGATEGSTHHYVYDMNDVTESLFDSRGSLEVAAAVTNIIGSAGNGPNISTGTDTLGTTGGFAVIASASAASSATVALQGSKSLKVTCVANGDGVAMTAAVSCTASTNYCTSAYVFFPSTSETVKLEVTGNASGVIDSTTASGDANTWVRIELAFTTGAGDNLTNFRFTSTTGAQVFYLDCIQIEAGTRASPWVNSAAARTAGGLDYGTGLADGKNFTINFWVKGYTAAPSATQYFVTTRYGTVNRILIYRATGTGNIFFYVNPGKDGVSGNVTVNGASANVFDSDWHMVTCVLNQAADGSTYDILEIFLDGTSEDTDNTLATAFDPSDTTLWQVGHINSANFFTGAIEELIFFPYAMTPTQVAALYAMGNTDSQAMSDLPKLYMDGDIVPDPEYTLEVIGTVTGVDYIQCGSVAAWENNRRVISFELEEV